MNTLMWHLSREPMKEISSLKKKVMYDEMCGRTRQRTNDLRDELIWGNKLRQ